jgi:hypothetical protein
VERGGEELAGKQMREGEARAMWPGKAEDAAPASVADRAASLWRSVRMASTRRTRRDGAKAWSARPLGRAWRGLPAGIAIQVAVGDL